MANKFLDEAGLQHLWGKIKEAFATKKELQDAVSGITGVSSEEKEIVYVDCDVDFSTFQISTEVSFDAIEAAILSGKYVIGRGFYSFAGESINCGYIPLSAYVPEQNQVMFNGLVQFVLGEYVAIVDMMIQIWRDGSCTLKARAVETTDIN